MEMQSFIEALEKAKSDKEKAMMYKKLGDFFVSKENFKNASEAFIKALALSKDFTEKEKIQMAIYIAWGDKITDAISVLREILLNNPESIEARINLARFLSWAGYLKEAIKESDIVLSRYPDHRDALLVKANALNWQGKSRDAISIYEKLLAEKEEFDVRLSYTYALLAIGDRRSAKENLKNLKPVYPYQERELQSLIRTIKTVASPSLDLSYSYYKDSDHNILNRYFANYSFWLNNLKFDLRYKHTNAKGEISKKRAEEISVSSYSKVTETLGLGVGIGYIYLHNNGNKDFFTGYVKSDLNIWSGTTGASISKEIFTDTAELIEKAIRFKNFGIYISQSLNERWSFYGSYNYKDYSDHNNSHDFQLTPRYLILNGNPRLSIGYTFRYLNFDRQSRGGYFDPEDFISNQISISFYYEKDRFYINLEPYMGYQSYKRFARKIDDFYEGGSGVLGYKISKDLSFEFNAEGGNYAALTAAGWRYYMIGFKMKSLF
jgi:thioredoxin-like negative regulator of GroEL